MNKAKGVYVWLCENKADDPSVFADGPGDLPEGPQQGTHIGADEEGIGVVQIGQMAAMLVALECEEYSDAHAEVFKTSEEFARKLVNVTRRPCELVLFGAKGREHIKWYRP